MFSVSDWRTCAATSDFLFRPLKEYVVVQDFVGRRSDELHLDEVIAWFESSVGLRLTRDFAAGRTCAERREIRRRLDERNTSEESNS